MLGCRELKEGDISCGGLEKEMELVVKEELCEKVVEVGRVSDRVMTVVVVFEEDVLRLICGFAPQSGEGFMMS